MADNPSAIADAIEALTIILRRDLERVWARVSAQVDALEADWPTMGAAARRRRLLELQTHIAGLADAADEIAARHVLAGVRDAYLLGAHATALTVGGAVASTGVDLDAITALAADTHADLLHATTHMRATTKDLIRTLARDHVSDRLYTGTPATQAGRDLAKALRGKSIAAIVYKDGSRHGLGSYADMVVRTKTAEAYQVGGFNQAESHQVKFMEIMDGPGCGLENHDSPTLANGMIVTLDQARAYPISHPNCVMPETVSGFYGGALQLIRAWYDGPSYALTTHVGTNTTTVGPNHPVLTARGWVRASLLNEGDQLVHDSWAPRSTAIAVVPKPDLEHMPPTIEDVFETIRSVGSYSSVPATSDDLHGDAVFCEGEINVVDTDRVLLLEGDPSFLEQAGESDLVWSDAVAAHPVAVGPDVELSSGALDATDRVMGCSCSSGSRLGCGCGRGEKVGFRDRARQAEAAQLDADGSRIQSDEPSDDRARHLVADVHVDQDLVGDETLSGDRFLLVALERIDVGHHVGWVYDATTAGGAFTADGIVVRNCRRVTMARPDIKSLVGAKPMGPQFTAQQLKDAADGADVGFRKVVDRRGNGTLAPVASVARGPAAVRLAALQARRSA